MIMNEVDHMKQVGNEITREAHDVGDVLFSLRNMVLSSNEHLKSALDDAWCVHSEMFAQRPSFKKDQDGGDPYG